MVVAEMYLTLLPVIIAGSFNMIWCKLPFLKALQKPMDGGRVLRDGKRVFGDNKTWKGFVGMLVLGTLFTVVWGLISGSSEFLQAHNYLYRNYDNTVGYNALAGFLFGLAYAVFELPNSFIKRRLGIEPGKKRGKLSGAVNVFIDQADSVIGCVLVLSFLYRMSVWFFAAYVLLGAATHIVINMLLYLLKLRKNMF